jgi:hypothetical protein
MGRIAAFLVVRSCDYVSDHWTAIVPWLVGVIPLVLWSFLEKRAPLGACGAVGQDVSSSYRRDGSGFTLAPSSLASRLADRNSTCIKRP